MRSWSLDDHPILVSFRQNLGVIPQTDGKYYHLFLPPPYALTQKMVNEPLKYVFATTANDPSTYVLFGNPKVTIVRSGQILYLQSGFSKNKAKIRIFMEAQCTAASGLSFTIYEIFTDIYQPKDATPFCKRILEVYEDPEASYAFLDKEIKNYKELKDLLKSASDYMFVTKVDSTNYQDFISRLQVTIGQICEAVFKLPMCRDLPVFVRIKLNYLIWNALSTKCHFKLLMAYHNAYNEQNLIAQKNARRYELVKNDRIEIAVQLLKNILHLPTPGDCVMSLMNFFDAVVKSFDGKDVAADDILPAICLAMSHDTSFGSHCVSFLTYLVEIWPQVGLEEKASYVLVTCSIAATHLGMPMADPSPEETMPKEPEAPPKRELTEEEIHVTGDTIDMLNNLLDMI